MVNDIKFDEIPSSYHYFIFEIPKMLIIKINILLLQLQQCLRYLSKLYEL